jgi:uncharacterized SAM-binding protein YcdF (DUF218 family)
MEDPGQDHQPKAEDVTSIRFVTTGAAISTTATSNQKSSGMARSRGADRLRHYLVFALLFVAFSTGAWFVRTPVLQGAADLWVVSDPITPADAVVVLRGGYDVRPVVAADLYKKGLVRKVLISHAEDGSSAKIGILPNHADIDLTVLRKMGVPDGAIEFFGKGSKNTWGEAVALRRWTKQHPTSALIIPAEVFFARRARWVFQRAFSGTGIRIEVPSFDPPHAYARAGWWKTGAWSTFPNEVIKYVYYRFRY